MGWSYDLEAWNLSKNSASPWTFSCLQKVHVYLWLLPRHFDDDDNDGLQLLWHFDDDNDGLQRRIKVWLNGSWFFIHSKALNFHDWVLCYHEPFHNKIKR